MTTQWHSNAVNNGSSVNSDKGDKLTSLMEENVVLLMQGKNNFGDKIYSYLKISLSDLPKLRSAIQGHEPFNPSDFGSVVAAGQGVPTDEVKAEIAAMYNTLEPSKLTQPATPAPPPEEKAWDEF